MRTGSVARISSTSFARSPLSIGRLPFTPAAKELDPPGKGFHCHRTIGRRLVCSTDSPSGNCWPVGDLRLQVSGANLS
jgi:hypothetical protein